MLLYFFKVLILTLSSCFSEKVELELAVGSNIVLIVADDRGYADLKFPGRDTETPNIINLLRGIVTSCFHIANMRAPTRAMLRTGQENHIAGMGV